MEKIARVNVLIARTMRRRQLCRNQWEGLELASAVACLNKAKAFYRADKLWLGDFWLDCARRDIGYARGYVKTARKQA